MLKAVPVFLMLHMMTLLMKIMRECIYLHGGRDVLNDWKDQPPRQPMDVLVMVMVAAHRDLIHSDRQTHIRTDREDYYHVIFLAIMSHYYYSSSLLCCWACGCWLSIVIYCYMLPMTLWTWLFCCSRAPHHIQHFTLRVKNGFLSAKSSTQFVSTKHYCTLLC